MEDYIAQQEIIVPVVVGGILSVLLAAVFLSYVIAYAVRRRKEAKEWQCKLRSGSTYTSLWPVLTNNTHSLSVCVCVCVKCIVYVHVHEMRLS